MAYLSPDAAGALLRVLDQDIPQLTRALQSEADPETRRWLESQTENLMALRHRLCAGRKDRIM